jgi:hypothetical protein
MKKLKLGIDTPSRIATIDTTTMSSTSETPREPREEARDPWPRLRREVGGVGFRALSFDFTVRLVVSLVIAGCLARRDRTAQAARVRGKRCGSCKEFGVPGDDLNTLRRAAGGDGQAAIREESPSSGPMNVGADAYAIQSAARLAGAPAR